MVSTIKTLLVIGANRGIGHELVTRFQKKGYQVWGTYRPQSRDDISVIELKKQGVHTLEVDFLEEDSIIAAAKVFGEKPLDVLVNCAGIYNDWDDKRFYEQAKEDFLSHFKVNTIGPFLTSREFLPALQQAKLGKIINISSNMAGFANNYGGNACYRVSKTALNQLTKTSAVDLEKVGSRVITLAVHPGSLPTRLSGGRGKDDMETCMKGLVETIERFGTVDGKEIENGSWVKWTGEKLNY